MTKQRTSRTTTGGMLVLGLFVVGLLMPTVAEAQCAACGEDPQEKTIECIDVPWGADSCSSGTYQGSSWCETSGICEWIVLLEFGEDGTAFSLQERERAPLLGVIPALEQETSVAARQSCDGVILSAGRTEDTYAVIEDFISLEL